MISFVNVQVTEDEYGAWGKSPGRLKVCCRSSKDPLDHPYSFVLDLRSYWKSSLNFGFDRAEHLSLDIVSF